MSSTHPIIVWFRHDLRLADNPALFEAAKLGAILPIFILDDQDRKLGGAAQWWLHHSLISLKQSLGDLHIFKGNPDEILDTLIAKTGANSVFWNRSYEPHSVNRDTQIKSHLNAQGIDARSFKGSVIFEPWELQTGSGGPYKIYAPFWKSALRAGLAAPIPAPSEITLSQVEVKALQIEELNLMPKKPDWAKGWETLWQPGEDGASKQLDEFLDDGIAGYGTLRDRPDRENVSRLSPHLHFGEISPRQACAKANFASDKNPELVSDITKFVAEIGWRDFANHLMFHFPEITTRNWKPAFDAYPWIENNEHLKAWQQGKTGYPMIDAGMRELWHTGYMHNRVRMLVASFLIKHLRIHWREGEKWFWDTLLDADLANNCASWQWVAGSGADASPYFRIFNPISQGPKFDPNGDYVRKWCPELTKLDNKVIHCPFEASPMELAAADIKLGETYPLPIVDHKQAREAALEGYHAVRTAQSDN